MTITIPIWVLWAAGIAGGIVVLVLAALGLCVLHMAYHWSRR